MVRTMSATARHAPMLARHCPFPWDVSVPSRSRMIWGCMDRLGFIMLGWLGAGVPEGGAKQGLGRWHAVGWSWGEG